MTKLHTSVAQWGRVSGIRQDASDLIAVAPPPSHFSPEARKGRLVVVVEAEDDVARGRHACSLVARTIFETFYEDGAASVTSSLRAALKAANAALYQFNFEAPPHRRATVGVSCAVFHGHDLYVTQVPPAQAFVAHAGKLRALPNPPSWTGGAQSGPSVGFSTALGTSLGSEAEFFRSVVQAGDTVVLASSNVGRLLSKQQAEQLICFSDAATVAEAMYQLCQRNHLPEAHAVVIELMPELSAAARESPLSPAGVSERGKLAVGRLGDWMSQVTSEARRGRKSSVHGAPAREPSRNGTHAIAPEDEPIEKLVDIAPVEASLESPPEHAPNGAPPIENGGGALLDRVPVGDADPLAMSAFIGEGPYGGVVRPPAVKRDRPIDLGDNTGVPIDFASLPKKVTPPPPGLIDRATLPARGAVVGLLSGMSNMRRRTKRPLESPPRPPRTKVRGLSYRRERPSFPWLNILLIVGVLTLLVVVGLQQNRRRDQRAVQKELDEVATAVAAAETAPSELEAQQHLGTAEIELRDTAPLIEAGLLDETKTALWGSYQQVLQRYDRARSTINRIGVLSEIEVIATLPVEGGQASRLVLATDPATVTGLLQERLFVLDRGRDGGTLYTLGAQGLEQLLAPGQEAGSLIAGAIRELLWREDNPVALDRDPNPLNPIASAFLRSPDGWLANRLQGSELLPEGDIPAASFGGNLYLWDSERRQLMKYTSGQYGDLPTEWIVDPGAAQLNQVVCVQIDGDIWLLQTDGTIAVFRGGVFQRTLPVPQLSPPVQTITRFYVTPDVIDEVTGNVVRPGYVFLLDTLNERVIQISKADGAVIQQIQARERGRLNRLMDLQVDGARNQVYLANGNEILRAPLPAPPAERTTSPSVTTTPAQ